MSDVFCAIHGSQYMTTAGVCQMCAAGNTQKLQSGSFRSSDGVWLPQPSPLFNIRLSVEGPDKYTYTFHPAPAHGGTFSRSLWDVFAMIPMLTLDFTEAEFAQFRLDLLRDGF